MHRNRGGANGRALRTAAVAAGGCALLLLLAGSTCFADGIDVSQALEEMGVTLKLPDGIEMVPRAAGAAQEEVEYQRAFRFPGARYEVRMSLFPQSWLVRQSCGGDIDQYVPLFAMGLAAGIAKDRLYFSKAADLPPATVKEEFGADRGMTALLKGNRSDFARGWTHVAIALLYKVGAGVVVLYFLYNEPRDLEMEGLDFGNAYYCFRFEEVAGCRGGQSDRGDSPRRQGRLSPPRQ